MNYSDLKRTKLTNGSILIDVSHAKTVGDKMYSDSGIALGIVQVSEVPSYGVVVDYSPELVDKGVKKGQIIPIPVGGVLRVIDWPGKPKDLKLSVIRFDNVDCLIEI